ncbi:MAG: delta-60 repeat domain-containing protein [Flavobacteriales bacterium]|nr:delta-60 repeat domain-containing protein [Flavobacteriales bacterium]
MALSPLPLTVDFTDPATSTWGADDRYNINGTMVLWPGDANNDGTVIYTGSNNDRDLILTAIGGTTPTNTVTNTYSPLDINMDGVIRYTERTTIAISFTDHWWCGTNCYANPAIAMRALSFIVFLLGVPVLGQFAGDLDQSFNSTDLGFDDPSTGANGEIRRVVSLDDGTLLIGGVFTTYNGVARIGMARVHQDGSLDPSFMAPAMTVLDMLRTADGRIIVAGSTIVAGTAYQLFRLLPDGSLDPSFPLINGTSLQPLGPVQDNVVQSVSISPDQFLYFSHTALVSTGGGSVRLTRIRRVDLSGVLDASYLTLSVSDSYGMGGVTGLVHQADGKLLVHGKFYSPTNRCMRMNADFSVDYTISGVSSNFVIQDMVVQPDGKDRSMATAGSLRLHYH